VYVGGVVSNNEGNPGGFWVFLEKNKSFPGLLLQLSRSKKWGKTWKTRGFLGYCVDNAFPKL
jgi:hypothetical protein